MRPSSSLLAALSIAGASAGGNGDDHKGGAQWTTLTHWETKWQQWEKPEKETVTVWETQWLKPEKVMITSWEPKWAKPDAITIYTTVWSTQWHNQSTIVTSISTDTLTATESVYITKTATEIHTETRPQTETETKTATATVTSANVVKVTELATVTDTITKFETCSTTESLVGLVTCPSRTINPTYTAPTALPTDWLWGCPPGTICTPKQIDCNFEQNLPSDEFICSPDECLAVKPLPPLPLDWDPHNCTPYDPPEGYFNLAPPIFGLDYDIFAFNGQLGPSCPPEPPAAISSSSGWQDWPAPASQTKAWKSWEQPKPSDVSGWKDWNGKIVSKEGESMGGGHKTLNDGMHHTGKPAPPGITPRAVHVERQTGADLTVPDACFNPCNAAAANGQSCGLQASILCPSSGVFSQQLDMCQQCVDVLKARAVSEVPALLPSLATFINFCAGAMETGGLERRNAMPAPSSTINVQQALETSAPASMASTAAGVATSSGPSPSLSTGAAAVSRSTSFLLLTLGVGIALGVNVNV